MISLYLCFNLKLLFKLKVDSDGCDTCLLAAELAASCLAGWRTNSFELDMPVAWLAIGWTHVSLLLAWFEAGVWEQLHRRPLTHSLVPRCQIRQLVPVRRPVSQPSADHEPTLYRRSNQLQSYRWRVKSRMDLLTRGPGRRRSRSSKAARYQRL
jgi:hypothetical protein